MPPSSVCVMCWLESLQQETPFLLVAEIHHAIDVCADWIHAMIVTSGLPTKRVFMMERGDVDLLVSDVLASGGSPEVQYSRGRSIHPLLQLLIVDSPYLTLFSPRKRQYATRTSRTRPDH